MGWSNSYYENDYVDLCFVGCSLRQGLGQPGGRVGWERGFGQHPLPTYPSGASPGGRHPLPTYLPASRYATLGERADTSAADGCEIEVAVGQWRWQVEANDPPSLEHRVHVVEATLVRGRHRSRVRTTNGSPKDL